MTVEATATPAPAAAPVTPPAAVAAAAPAPAATPASPAAAPAATPPQGAAPPAKGADAAPAATIIGAEPVKAPEANIDATVEANKAPEQKKEEGGQSAEPAPPPAYEPFTLAEGVAFDKEKLGEFTGLLSELELAKGDHAKMQAAGQKMLDKYVVEMQGVIQKQNEAREAAFEKQVTDWQEAFMKDPEIGGTRWEASRDAAKEFIRTHGGSETQQKEFRDLMNTTGVGNHPSMIRILAKAMSAMREGRPLAAQTPESRPMSKIEKRYGKM